MSSETDHVDPLAHPGVGGVFTELPARADQPVDVVGDIEQGWCCGVMRRSPKPKSSALLVAYFAMYRAACSGVSSPAGGPLTVWVSSWVPKRSTSPP